jgi:hypothetical protein
MEQSVKQLRQMVSTDAGTSIEPKEEQPRNDPSPSLQIVHPDSNATLPRDWQYEKHRRQRTLTLDGMQIVANDEQFANNEFGIEVRRQPNSKTTM